MDVDYLYTLYVDALSAYESFVRADPDMLASAPEARRLKAAADRAWTAYYNAAHSRPRAAQEG